MPVLAKKKTDNTKLTEATINAIDSAINGTNQLKAESTPRQTITPGEASNKETNITFRLTESEKKAYKAFFLENNISLSFGIKLAIERLMTDTKAGKGIIKKTGFYER